MVGLTGVAACAGDTVRVSAGFPASPAMQTSEGRWPEARKQLFFAGQTTRNRRTRSRVSKRRAGGRHPKERATEGEQGGEPRVESANGGERAVASTMRAEPSERHTSGGARTKPDNLRTLDAGADELLRGPPDRSECPPALFIASEPARGGTRGTKRRWPDPLRWAKGRCYFLS